MKLEEEDLMPDIMPSDAINTLETFSFYSEKVFSQGPLKILEHQANSLSFNSETYTNYGNLFWPRHPIPPKPNVTGQLWDFF